VVFWVLWVFVFFCVVWCVVVGFVWVGVCLCGVVWWEFCCGVLVGGVVCCGCWWWLAIPVLYHLVKMLLRKKVTPDCYQNKVVVVTGASSGIGEELALQYAKLGCSIVISARRAERLEQLSQKIEALYKTSVQVVVCDVSKADDCQRLIQEVISKQGKLDTLVLNAGVAGGNTRFDEFKDLTKCHEVMDTNYWGCVTPTFHALPHLKASRGQIIAVSSLASISPSHRRTAYTPTKSALNGFFDCLRVELKGTVTVTVPCPGYVETEIHDSILKSQHLKKNAQYFMSARECAAQIIESGYNGDGITFMMRSARILHAFRPLLPQAVFDQIINKAASGAFSSDDKKSA